MKLYPHQEIGVEWLCKTRRGLLADDQGLGKTIQVVAAAQRLDCRRVLVVAPAAVTFNWRAEFVKWGAMRPEDVQVITGSGQDVGQTQRVVVVAHSMLFRDPLLGKMKKERFDLVVIDEAHGFRTPGAKRTLALYSGKEAVCRLAPRSWTLTGTPLPNGDPAEVWTMLAGIAPERIRGEDGKLLTWGQWRSRFAVTVPTIYGDRVESLKNLPELNRRLAGFMLRRLKKNVLADLPPIRWSTVALDSLAAERAALATVDREDGEAFATWRKGCGVAKAGPAVELLKTELEGGLPCVVVFAQHVEVLDRLCDGLAAYRPLRIDGQLSAAEKADAVAAFQRPESPHRVIVVQLQAGGVGITLTRASDVVFVETSSVPGDMAQCADRVHRIGQKSSVLVRILALAGTVDEVYADALARKSAMVSEVMRASEQNADREGNPRARHAHDEDDPMSKRRNLVAPPLPDRIAAAIDDERLIDNAACASQLRALLDEETTRQAVKDNVCAPLRAQLAAANAQRDELLELAKECRDEIAYVGSKALRERLRAAIARAQSAKPAQDDGADSSPVGTNGQRDPDHPCDMFRSGEPSDRNTCEGDGHYLCNECGHYRCDPPKDDGAASGGGQPCSVRDFRPTRTTP